MGSIKITGVIVPFDAEGYEGMTGLEQFEAQFAKCGSEGIDLYIDSVGGDVGTSNSITVALSKYWLDNPEAKCTCTIGGICASAAANIVAKLPPSWEVRCFTDSLFMYHSCRGFVEGGPDELRDNAVLMDLINSVVAERLISKTTLDPAEIRGAFKGDRELWIGGKQAVECGLANSLLDGDMEPSVALSAVHNERVCKLVACLGDKIQAKIEEMKSMADEKTPEVVEENVEVTDTKAEVDTPVEDTEAKAECGKEDIEAMKAECETLKAQNAELTAKVAELKALVDKYGVEASVKTAQAPKKDFAALVREIPAGLSESEYTERFIALKKEHLEEFEAYMKSHTNRG